MCYASDIFANTLSKTLEGPATMCPGHLMNTSAWYSQNFVRPRTPVCPRGVLQWIGVAWWCSQHLTFCNVTRLHMRWKWGQGCKRQWTLQRNGSTMLKECKQTRKRCNGPYPTCSIIYRSATVSPVSLSTHILDTPKRSIAIPSFLPDMRSLWSQRTICCTLTGSSVRACKSTRCMQQSGSTGISCRGYLQLLKIRIFMWTAAAAGRLCCPAIQGFPFVYDCARSIQFWYIEQSNWQIVFIFFEDK